MIERIEGIVTDVIKHNDKHNVVTLYTKSRGRMAFIVPVSSSKSGRLRNSTLALMSVVSADVNIKSGKELYTLRNFQPVRLWHGIYADPVKSSLLFFITEFCNKLVRQYPPDDKLWEFLLLSLETLDKASARTIVNFHIAFLIQLSHVAGIEPAVKKYEDGKTFDMLAAEMIDPEVPSLRGRRILLSPEESSKLSIVLRMNYANMGRFKITKSGRNQLLSRLLEYYSIHLPIGNEYKSLRVLREIFA